ncbi:MAG: PilC/PilY family type IV pilus protein, partial [Pseudomonadota bacterium]
MKSKFQCLIAVFLYASIASWPTLTMAQDLDIADTPLFAAVSIDPNVMFTLDDSGSMQWEYMPDGPEFRFTIAMFPRPVGLYGGVDYANQVPSHRNDNLHHYYGRSAANNAVFYDPDLTYRPWANADGTLMPDADPGNALYNPSIPALGGLNLRQQQTQVAVWFSGTAFDGAFCDPCGGNSTYWPITYFNYNGGDRTLFASYTQVQITTATGAGASFTSPGGITRTRDEEIQNFANWFQYSRSRILSARNGIGRAFTELPPQARVGFGAINQGSTTVDGVSTNTIVDGVRPFGGVFRENFYNQLYGRVINNFGTPLRTAAQNVGNYFARADARGPWSTLPGVVGGSDLACRQSYHIMMTDGFWNGGAPTVGNSDNVAGPTHTSPTGDSGGYVPGDPYRDGNSNTLADVAMDFWKRDLRGDLQNRVPTNDVDTAFWQHLTTFGIGLGVRGALNPADVDTAVENGTAVTWGDPFNNNPAKIDDLLHFGLNGRGGFFSASDPDAFAAQLGAILRDIVARSGATTGLSASSTRLNQGAVVYTAGFDSESWSGDLLALDVATGNQLFSAADQLDVQGFANRTIATWDPTQDQGVDFSPTTSLTARVMANAPALMTAPALFDYLSGDMTAGAGSLRARDSMLGDIVGSQPVFSGPRNEGWGLIDNSYFNYIDSTKRDPRDDCGEPSCPGSRRNTVFIGANDGMLHAFDAVTLTEHFAYVPAAVHDNLWELADPNYSHRYYVDGQTFVADANLGGGWGTYLVGGLGAGGRGIYALNVTAPQSFSSATGVLWELNSESDPDIGFTFGKPAIGKINGGPWVAVFGNGYNSVDNKAYLYVVRLDNGSVFAKIPVGSGGANGLSGVSLVGSVDDPLHIRYIYAGDLEGNMWRFDVDSGGVGVSFGGNPLFTDPDGRPIIAAPDIARHPVDGRVVYFGTGKLIENFDRLNSSILERFYAVRDLEANVSSINDLNEVPVSVGPSGERQFQPVAQNASGWWAPLAGGTPNGERVLFSPVVFAGRVLFSSYEPANDPCTPGGIQRAYVLNALSGGGLFPSSETNVAGIVVGTGAALAPVIGIKDSPNTIGTPGNDPGVTTPPPDCDPADPGCQPPTDPTNPQGAAT